MAMNLRLVSSIEHRESNGTRRIRPRFWLVAIGLTVATVSGCGASPRIANLPGYSHGMLHRKTLLLLPLATSNEMGDDRSGVVLRNVSVRDAYDAVCKHAKQSLRDVVVECAQDPGAVGAVTLMRSVLASFAHDEPVSKDTCTALAKSTGASFALLFRPEGVEAAHSDASRGPVVHVTQTHLHNVSPVANAIGNGMGNFLGTLITMGVFSVTGGPSASSSRTYAVSAALLNLSTGSPTTIGAFAATATREGDVYPEPAPILTKAMVELADAIVDQ